MASSRLAGKVAIVTASTEGIGFAIAQRLAQDGAKVMISSRKQKNVDAAVGQLKRENLDVAGIVCHVAKKQDRLNLIEETKAKFGGIDILVSNAAANTHLGSTLAISEQAFDKMFETNVKAMFMLCQETVPEIEKRGGGSILLVSSVGGYTPGLPIGVYAMTKTTLLGMVKMLAPELAQSNIRINGLAPGLIETRMSTGLRSSDAALEQALARIPLGRLGKPEDCAGMASFLVSDDAKFITAENVVVAGGQQSRL